MLLFAITGITLNHAGRNRGAPAVAQSQVRDLACGADWPVGRRRRQAPASVLPRDVRDWLRADDLGVDVRGREAEWSAQRGLCRAAAARAAMPGSASTATAARCATRRTDRGWISYLNDLHKGRNTGAAWSWFIDLFAVACFVFCVTGLVLLQLHVARRPATWPMVGLGFVIPLLSRRPSSSIEAIDAWHA